MREDAPSPDSARSHASASANANANSSYGSTPFPFAAKNAAGGLAASSEAPRAENASRFFLRSASSTATLSPTRNARSAAGPTRSPLTNAVET